MHAHTCHAATAEEAAHAVRRSYWDDTMSRKGCIAVTKYFLFLFNFFFFLLGGLLFSFGLWLLFDRDSFAAVLGSAYYALKIWSYIFCGVGILTMWMGFLGCLGSLKEIKCMLGCYFAFLLLLFLAQIIIGILVYSQSKTLNTKVGDYVTEIIEHYGTYNPSTDEEESWDYVQMELQCCGWILSNDWMENSIIKNSSYHLYPCSCRGNVSQPGQPGNSTTAAPTTRPKIAGFCNSYGQPWSVYEMGCMDGVQTWLTNNIITIVGISLGIALMELCLMTLSMFLCRTIGPNYDKLTRYS
ncbi:leukocyte antigen CD37 isoform X2 [Podarcis raffonei]|uniref:leukocyte antigen CD37 isoform X2 n=1 Tax=Podarcis raffonei TaxID=65483 RepID=UPI0023297A40|nr:leukocyte antigen CD37 isoform X2 [Podarcis raffonei]